MFHSIKPLTFWASLKSINLRLWDESDRRLISWKEYKQRYGQKASTASFAKIAKEKDLDLPLPDEAGTSMS
jgi:hypothetical protein